MIEFRNALRDKLLELLQLWTNASSGIATPVVSFDDHLFSQPIENLPFYVVHVPMVEEDNDEEIGTNFGTRTWNVELYYLDMTKEGETWRIGDDRRNSIVGLTEKNLKRNKRLDNLQVVDVDGVREYVYDSKIRSATFDTSGQEGEYSFVTVLYLTVHTDVG